MDKIFEIEPLGRFNSIFEDILINLYHSHQISDLESHILQAAKEDIKRLIENSNLDINRITEQLLSQGLSETKVQSLVSLIDKQKTELLYATIQHYNSKYGQVIYNFDWSLKLIKGTNDLKTLDYPLLQLELHIKDSEGKLKKSLFDINKEMLCKLITILENNDLL